MIKYVYQANYSGKKVQFEADNLYDAKLKALVHFKPPKSKRGLVSVLLCGKIADGVEVEVVHNPSIL